MKKALLILLVLVAVGCKRPESKHDLLDRMFWNEVDKWVHYDSLGYLDSIKMSEYCIKHIEKEKYNP